METKEQLEISCRPTILKPRRLRVGDTVAVVAPASPLTAEKFNKVLKNIESLGLKPKIMPHAQTENGYLAGTDAQRVADLHAAFLDPDCAGVWCARGGYGTARLLDKLDFSLIKKHPKVFVGYSDITALHVAIHQQTGLITFHGPVGTSDFTDYTVRHIKSAIFEPNAPFIVESASENEANASNLYKTEIISEGRAKGRLIGGNLSLLSAAAGTKFFPDVANKILFIEDVDERPYRVDRMLVQLLQTTDLRKVAGIALGIFSGCNPLETENSLSLSVCLKDLLSKLGVPVVYGLSFGHIEHQFTLPVGIEAELMAEKGKITFKFLENGVL
jgi:muramoyltetrapeptide carboxypeptidase